MNDAQAARDYEGELGLKIELGRSEFDRNDPNISIGLRIETKPETADPATEPAEESGTAVPAFVVEVELQGNFVVDYAKFSFENLARWAEVNAPFILLPYAREQVYGLALRAGIRGLTFPLFIQPGTGPRPGQNESSQK
ncbi:hypothetical protein [Roseateles flavus]|uniref:Protein-export chaperone SecB n=1 Tax=Roseateles flavus TaxID=3149041 RepID=A0ABV0GBF0_9BURK